MFEMFDPTVAPTVLIVEPKRNALGVFARRLSEAGLKVLPTDNAIDAFAMLHRHRVDLVLSELRMPGKDGLELTRLIRDETALADLHVMLITGRSDRKGAVLGYEAGCDDVIAKPFDTDVLVARIKRRFARARSLGELKRDKATLDARVVERSIQIGELKDRLAAFERGQKA
ncbi:response regulator [Sphingomicrobium nitratireducens]|uniref:response regulator n=1 Tax=Sphingomicrobium nitratireducens TaxID=2964666 RepID=UPI00223EABFD|nr:response regulator [Sphingomicrobium nitratireducens]